MTAGVSNQGRPVAHPQVVTPIAIAKQQQMQQQQFLYQSREDAGIFPRPIIGEPPKQGEKRTIGGFFKSVARSATNFVVGGTIGKVKELVKGAFFDENGNFSLFKTARTLLIGGALAALMFTPAGWIVGLGLATYGLVTAAPKLITHTTTVISSYANGNWEAAEDAAYKAGSSFTDVALSAYGASAALKGVTALNAAKNAQAVNQLKGLYEAKGALTAAKATGDASKIATAQSAFDVQKAAAIAMKGTGVNFKAGMDAYKASQIAQSGTVLQKASQVGKELTRPTNYKNLVGPDGIGRYYNGPNPFTRPAGLTKPSVDPKDLSGTAESFGEAGKAVMNHGRQVGPNVIRGVRANQIVRNARDFAYQSGNGNVLKNIQYGNIAASGAPMLIKQSTEEALDPYAGMQVPAGPVAPVHHPGVTFNGHRGPARITPSTRHLAGTAARPVAGGGGH